MPRKLFQISKFTGGMILNADPSDLPEGFGVACLDATSSLDSGMITGRYDDGESDGIDHVVSYAYLSDNASYYLASLDEAGAFNVNGAAVDAEAAGKTITGHRNYVLIGKGAGVRTGYYGYPNGLSTPVECDNDMDPGFVSSTIETWTGMKIMEEGTVIYYAAALVYDGYMYGPLKKLHSIPINQEPIVVGEVSYPTTLSTLRMTISVTLSEGMEGRVTKLILYRSVALPGTSESNISSQYVHVAEFTDLSSEINYEEGNAVALETSEVVGGQTPQIGNSYANESGLDETVPYCTLGYSVAYEMNNFLFVGDVGHVTGSGETIVQDIPDGTRLLYRSLRGKHAQFNILSDYLALSFTPLAITSLNKRLLVFGASEFAVVDPESMTIEEIVLGYGVESPLCIHQTLAGIFFANQNNMYVYDGRECVGIGTPVMCFPPDTLFTTVNDLGVYSYEQIVREHGGIKKVTYSARTNTVLFLYSGPGSVYAYAFNLDTHAWAVYSFGSNGPTSAYINRANVLFIGPTRALASVLRFTNWKYITKRFNLGNVSQHKKIYAVRSASTMRSEDITFSFDGEAFQGAIDKWAANVAIKYEPSEELGMVRHIEITYRDMINVK